MVISSFEWYVQRLQRGEGDARFEFGLAHALQLAITTIHNRNKVERIMLER